MTSKTYQKKAIKNNKKRVHKENRKADQKRMEKNHAILFPKDEKS